MAFLDTPKGKKFFDQYLRKFQGKSSQKVYRSEIRQFFDFYSGDLTNLSGSVFLKYRDHLGQNVKAKTIKRKFSILNQFVKFLETKIKGFKSPIGNKHGDMQRFQGGVYLDSDAFKNQMELWMESLICDSTRKTYSGHVSLFYKKPTPEGPVLI